MTDGNEYATVADLRQALARLPPDLPVVILSPIILSPSTGVYGPRERYAIQSVAEVVVPRMEKYYPADAYRDDEAYTLVFPEWHGVIFQVRSV